MTTPIASPVNLNVKVVYVTGGIPIPWEPTVENEDGDVYLFYELSESVLQKTEMQVNTATGQLMLLERGGSRAAIIPLTMCVLFGKKASVLLA